MNKVIGMIIVVFGIAFGIYAGLWWAFIGGIVDIVNAVKQTDISAMGIAIGIVKIVFSGFIGWISGGVIVVLGLAFTAE